MEENLPSNSVIKIFEPAFAHGKSVSIQTTICEVIRAIACAHLDCSQSGSGNNRSRHMPDTSGPHCRFVVDTGSGYKVLTGGIPVPEGVLIFLIESFER